MMRASKARISTDVLIIGSGAGGSCVADTLTAAGRHVLMLEEGPFTEPAIDLPSATRSFPGSWRCGGLTVALGPTPIAYAEGRCVGGGTEINSAIFQEVGPNLLDYWGRLYRISDFSHESLAPYYARAAAIVNASLTPGSAGEPTEILRRAGRNLGWRVTELKRGQRDCVGTNFCSFGCPTGGKQSMSVTLIPQSRSRGMQLLANTRVAKLEHQHGRVSAALAQRKREDGTWEFLRIEAEHVFVCGGAIQTPALLLRSGIRRQIGRTLRLHPTIKCAALFDHDLNAAQHRLPLTAITEFMPEQRIGGAFFSPAVFAMGLGEDWERRRHLMDKISRCGSYYAMIRPIGVGSVRLLPFADEPLVRYRLAPEDWSALGQAASRLGRAMFAAGAELVYPSVTGHGGWRRADETIEYAESPLPPNLTNLMTIHLFGSCPMGEDLDSCAVDSYGRVRDFTNLTVADASVLPEAPGSNPQGTVMALALRAAEAFLATISSGVRSSDFAARTHEAVTS